MLFRRLRISYLPIPVNRISPRFRSTAFLDRINVELAGIKDAGTWKNERVIASTQEAEIKLNSGATSLNFCANNVRNHMVIHILFIVTFSYSVVSRSIERFSFSCRCPKGS